MKTIFSGMQPSGEIHLGNYFGALREWVSLSNNENYIPIYCIVDAHAITVPYDNKDLQNKIMQAAISYISAGINLERSIIFVQSHVPYHTELAWYLNCITSFGELGRMTQFKEKTKNEESFSAGIFNYPVLMAADILLYDTNLVPVGDDQLQHLELTRSIANKFNKKFGEIFTLPEPYLSKSSRIMGLDGLTKMSKSKNNYIGLLEDQKSIEKKIKKAFTDPNKLRLGDSGNPDICNIYNLHNATTDKSRLPVLKEDCISGKMGCGECKKILCDSLNVELSPIRKRAEELKSNPSIVSNILKEGANKAKFISSNKLNIIKQKMGLV